jgi:hypothetical protein
MRKQYTAILIFLLLLSGIDAGFAQTFEMQGNDTINKTDEQGWKQGKMGGGKYCRSYAGLQGWAKIGGRKLCQQQKGWHLEIISFAMEG